MTAIATQRGVRNARVIVPLEQATPEQAAPEQAARLSFDSGLEQVELRRGDAPEALLTAAFGEPLPVAWVADRNVHIEYPTGSRLLRRFQPSIIWINPTVSWSLDVHGGASGLAADLTDVDVHSIAFHSGAARLRLALGHPSRPCPIQLGSVSALRIERPAGVPVRLEITRGASKVALDRRWLGAVGSGLVDETTGFHPETPHYAVTVAGGAAGITIVEVDNDYQQ